MVLRRILNLGASSEYGVLLGERSGEPRKSLSFGVLVCGD
jgi:hypothetical protein